LGLAGLALLGNASWPPRIELIQPILFNGTNAVFIHFDTEADYYYDLEYTETITNGVPGGNWTRFNKQPYPKLPWVNHYVEVDLRTSQQRFYRLRAYR
jgi:hypothetical protein